jgi:hypothetical protein
MPNQVLVTTQHSLPSGRCPLLRADFHRLDRTSLRLAHSFDHLVGARTDRGLEPAFTHRVVERAAGSLNTAVVPGGVVNPFLTKSLRSPVRFGTTGSPCFQCQHGAPIAAFDRLLQNNPHGKEFERGCDPRACHAPGAASSSILGATGVSRRWGRVCVPSAATDHRALVQAASSPPSPGRPLLSGHSSDLA